MQVICICQDTIIGRMKYLKFIIVILIFSGALFSPTPQFAQEKPSQEILKGKVLRVEKEGIKETAGGKNLYQTVRIKLEKDDLEIVVNHGDKVNIREDQKVKAGDKVVISKLTTPQGTEYLITDKYRLDNLGYIVLAFFALVIVLSRLKGLGSIIGLLLSLFVILKFIVPQILAGHNPLLVSILGSLFIMLTTIYLAHGISKKTNIALAATSASLILAGVLSYFFVSIAGLSGLGSEDAYSLQFAQTGVNLKGLLLGGIIIGTLGVLDDVTTSLAAAISEISKANPRLKYIDLATIGMRVGSEHISSLVNTLVLAYAGASLPIFLFIIINPTGQPLWAILNSEILVEEIVRTLSGSIGLVLAVPITTVIAAFAYGRKG